jgi:hypothetical protein
MKKWSARPSAAVLQPPAKAVLPSRPAATDWKIRCAGTARCTAQKRQA